MKPRPHAFGNVYRIALAAGFLLYAAPAAADSVSFHSRMEKLFPVRVRARYFVYFSELSSEKTRGYADLWDAFVDEVNTHFFSVENGFRLPAWF